MNLIDLNKEYDKLQIEYGAKELNSIYNGGGDKEADILFVFMNQTGRNVASLKSWNGIRSPWIGTKNIWKLFYNVGLFDEKVFYEIQSKKPNDWDESFAKRVYDEVKNKKYFITNLGKCTQTDAKHLPNCVYEKYLDLLCDEIEIIKPKKIVTFGNQVSTIFLGENINVSKCRKQAYKKKINKIIYD